MERGYHSGILFPQTLQQLDRERGSQRSFQAPQHGVGRLGVAAADTEQPVGQRVGLVPGCLGIDDVVRQTPQILHQHDPQRDRDRPEFADRQRLHALVGADEPAQHLRVEVAIGMGDERPRQPVHARVSLERSVDQFGELAMEAGREIDADRPDLLLDDMEIIDQPICRRSDGAFPADRRDRCVIGRAQRPIVVAQAPLQALIGPQLRCGALRGREALGMQLEPLDAEEFRADRLFVRSGESRRPWSENATDRCVQFCAQPRSDGRLR